MCNCAASHPGIECDGDGCYCHHDWPCDRREAHGPHPRPPVEIEGTLSAQRDCPGVKAHPGVMIGRGELTKDGRHV